MSFCECEDCQNKRREFRDSGVADDFDTLRARLVEVERERDGLLKSSEFYRKARDICEIERLEIQFALCAALGWEFHSQSVSYQQCLRAVAELHRERDEWKARAEKAERLWLTEPDKKKNLEDWFVELTKNRGYASPDVVEKMVNALHYARARLSIMSDAEAHEADIAIDEAFKALRQI